MRQTLQPHARLDRAYRPAHGSARRRDQDPATQPGELTKCVVHLTETKNGSARTVPLTQAAVTAFRDALANPVRPLDTDLIFFGEPGRDGMRRPYEFRPAWQRTIKAAGIAGLRFHDLRNETVCRLVKAGLGDQEVATISGHKSMQMLKRYTHLHAEDLVRRLDQLVG
jgi:integrase